MPPIRAQHVTILVEEAVLLLIEQPLDLALRDRHADRVQQCRQTGQRGLSLMILHQHETAQVRPKVASVSSGNGATMVWPSGVTHRWRR